MKELPAIPPAQPLPKEVTIWRICSRRHAESAFSGEGARRFGGRWNFPGSAMAYASDSLSLAALEIMVHADWQELPQGLVSVAAEVPSQLAAIRLEVQRLPANWRSYPAQASLRELGSRWLRKNLSALLIVPSAVIPQQDNFLLNPAHPEFSQIRQRTPQDFALDIRLF